MMSPPAGMRANHRFWVDDWEGFVARARTLVEEGRPDEIVLERPTGRFPVIARAATVLNLWVDHNAIEQCEFLSGLSVPLLHTLGGKGSSSRPDPRERGLDCRSMGRAGDAGRHPRLRTLLP
ncbi:hypothetical protein [Geobacter metallireducens]|nr:hypothetical protein [Geobacter metallireducens]